MRYHAIHLVGVKIAAVVGLLIWLAVLPGIAFVLLLLLLLSPVVIIIISGCLVITNGYCSDWW